ncbi:MAG: tetratricopeptide repeat protein [Planctomycetota bacterium]
MVTSTSDPTRSTINPHGYLGPHACAACHADRVTDFLATRHYLACVLPESNAMPVGFAPGKGAFIPHGGSVRFEMTQARGEFLQTAIRSTPTGEERISSPIGLVYGAGAESDEVYFTWHDDRLSELPMSWLHPLGEWGTASFDRDGSGDFSRGTTPRCMECHNTWMEHKPGTRNQYQREAMILGVTCEVCHGPGRDHVAFHQTHPEARSGQAVIHPKRLSRELQMDLCAQCHSNALKHRGPAFNYRPGQPLAAHYKTLVTKNPEDDHVANQVTYLRESKCFQKSETLTCVTCHNPHKAKALQDRGTGRSACLECHQVADCRERDRLPAAVQDNCVGCHMPKGNKIQVSFDTATIPYYAPVARWEHRIAVHPIARDEVLLAWYQTQSDAHSLELATTLSNSLTEHWLNLAEQCRREYRFLAAIEAYRQSLRLTSTSATQEKLNEVVAIQTALDADMTKALHQIQEGRFDEALEIVKRILAVKPTHAKAHGSLGTLYALKEQNELAAEHWQMVAQYDPDDPYGESMLGWQAYLQGRPEAAIEAYRRAEEIEPYDAKINYHTGLALVKLERWPDVIARFRKLLVIDPNHIEGCLGLNRALRVQGQPDEALPFAVRAAELSRDENLDVLLALAETHAEVGQFKDAESTANKMLKVAVIRNPNMLPEIRRRLIEWRGRSAKAAP